MRRYSFRPTKRYLPRNTSSPTFQHVLKHPLFYPLSHPSPPSRGLAETRFRPPSRNTINSPACKQKSHTISCGAEEHRRVNKTRVNKRPASPALKTSENPTIDGGGDLGPHRTLSYSLAKCFMISLIGGVTGKVV